MYIWIWHALEHEKHIHICMFPTKQQAMVVISPFGDYKIGEGLFSLRGFLTSEVHLNTLKTSWVQINLCLFYFCLESSDIYLLSDKGKDSCWPNCRLSLRLLLMTITATTTIMIKPIQTETAITIVVTSLVPFSVRSWFWLEELNRLSVRIVLVGKFPSFVG